MPMCSASSPMESPSRPRVVARLAAASRMARRLSTPSARGVRPARPSPSDRLDSKWWLFILDIIARPFVLCQRTTGRAFYRLLSGTPEDQVHEHRKRSLPQPCSRLRRGEAAAAEHLGERG